MPKKFCVSTKRLSKDEKKEFATELNDFVANKKSEFEERRAETQEDEEWFLIFFLINPTMSQSTRKNKNAKCNRYN